MVIKKSRLLPLREALQAGAFLDFDRRLLHRLAHRQIADHLAEIRSASSTGTPLAIKILKVRAKRAGVQATIEAGEQRQAQQRTCQRRRKTGRRRAYLKLVNASTIAASTRTPYWRESRW